jgi:hypothetical protein
VIHQLVSSYANKIYLLHLIPKEEEEEEEEKV